MELEGRSRLSIGEIGEVYPLIEQEVRRLYNENHMARSCSSYNPEYTVDTLLIWGTTPQSSVFWSNIHSGRFEAARELKPEYFGPRVKTFTGGVHIAQNGLFVKYE